MSMTDINSYGTNTASNVKFQYESSDNLNARIELHEKFSINKYGWNKWVFDQIEFDGMQRILELGCGNGGLWKSNLYRLPENLQITLSDFSSGMLESAKQSLNSCSYDFKFQVIDAQDIPYVNDTFDIVIANHMLYHVPERKKALSEIKRVLRKDGILYSTTIGLGHLKELMTLVTDYDSTIIYAANCVANDFGLENGAEQLSEFFGSVNVLRYKDSFEVTDADLLVNFVLSSDGFGNVTEKISHDKKDNFKKYISSIIEKDGCIRIMKDSGLFIAKKI